LTPPEVIAAKTGIVTFSSNHAGVGISLGAASHDAHTVRVYSAP